MVWSLISLFPCLSGFHPLTLQTIYMSLASAQFNFGDKSTTELCSCLWTLLIYDKFTFCWIRNIQSSCLFIYQLKKLKLRLAKIFICSKSLVDLTLSLMSHCLLVLCVCTLFFWFNIFLDNLDDFLYIFAQFTKGLFQA